MESSTGQAEFDLSIPRSEYARLSRGAAIPSILASVVVGLIAVGFGVFKYYLIWKYGLFSQQVAVLLGVLVTCVALVYISACTALMKRPGARTVKVDSHGVEFVYGPGSREVYSWNRAGDSFTLQDYSAHPTDLPSPTRLCARGNHKWSRYISLTREAFDSILTSAREHGAEVSSHPATFWSALGPGVIVHEIRGKSLAGHEGLSPTRERVRSSPP